MFKISEFSRLSQVSMKALRFYDRIGLLKPAHTAPLNGYRYYTSEQLFQLHRILAFKDLGLTLEQILQALDEQLSTEQIRGMLRLKQAQTADLIEQEQERLVRIEARLRLLEREGEASREVALKRVKEQTVAVLPTGTSLSASSLPFFFAELDSFLRQAGVQEPEILPHLVLWQDPGTCQEGEDDTFAVEVACPFSEPRVLPEPLGMRILPAIPLAASVMHQCQPQGVCSAMVDLGRWIEQNGYTISFANEFREVYFARDEQERYIAEAQISVEKG
ncbi:MerR family transcriptional regulator [Ktedonosporobacter rubrisoli]|uniref:MerR family transcriptional regulator n=1 Tax=Ktedonosporobacter rubrisoli TaxID=2509675 RepID=A0A4P6JZ28_KTERU|nr:MerR family transcriptional regulator [Ktedonosporobacter rubrisoli]QBD80845.1 MerR family transcriptional regulator [Ktedonosporobacter rubrisoli]